MNPSTLSRRKSLPPRAALTLVESRLPSDPFLLRRFEDFYREIVELRAQLAGHSSHAHSSHAHSSHEQVSLRPEDVHKKLLALLTEQEQQVSRTGTLLGAEMYRQAQRVMACMADDIFSTVHWPPGTQWCSLEVELFEAVEMHGLAPEGPCMRKLELLLGQDDPAYRELAAVYFYALSMDKNQQHVRQQYLQPLLDMISGGTKQKAEDTARMFAQSYVHTLTENRVVLLPSAERWWLVLVGIVLIWLAASWLLWQQVSSPLEHKLEEIHQALKP
jgi:hypothetical protein